MNQPPELNQAPLRALLREARPAPPWPPRFQEAVWRRLETAAATAALTSSALAWLELWVERLLVPRFAWVSLALLLAAGGLKGAVTSAGAAHQQAQQRYLAAVAPHALH